MFVFIGQTGGQRSEQEEKPHGIGNRASDAGGNSIGVGGTAAKRVSREGSKSCGGGVAQIALGDSERAGWGKSPEKKKKIDFLIQKRGKIEDGLGTNLPKRQGCKWAKRVVHQKPRRGRGKATWDECLKPFAGERQRMENLREKIFQKGKKLGFSGWAKQKQDKQHLSWQAGVVQEGEWTGPNQTAKTKKKNGQEEAKKLAHDRKRGVNVVLWNGYWNRTRSEQAAALAKRDETTGEGPGTPHQSGFGHPRKKVEKKNKSNETAGGPATENFENIGRDKENLMGDKAPNSAKPFLGRGGDG